MKSLGAAIDFDSLRHLSLTNFSLEKDYELLTSTLRIEQLQSLKLCECEKQSDFLEALARSDRGVNLRSFEIVQTRNGSHHDHTLVPIKMFLKSFTGLEDLCISVKEWYSTGESFLDSIRHHQKTLKRLVYHLRAIDENHESPKHNCWIDYSVPWEHELGSFLSTMKLDYVVFSLYPLTLVYICSFLSIIWLPC